MFRKRSRYVRVFKKNCGSLLQTIAFHTRANQLTEMSIHRNMVGNSRVRLDITSFLTHKVCFKIVVTKIIYANRYYPNHYSKVKNNLLLQLCLLTQYSHFNFSFPIFPVRCIALVQLSPACPLQRSLPNSTLASRWQKHVVKIKFFRRYRQNATDAQYPGITGQYSCDCATTSKR